MNARKARARALVSACAWVSIGILAPEVFGTSTALAQQAPATARGLVVTPSGEPAADAAVRVIGLGRHDHTDDEGRFSLSLPAGNHVIELYSREHGQATQRVSLEAGETLELRIELEPAFHAEPIIASVGPEARTQSEIFQPSDVVAGRELLELGVNSLGETLAERPGMNSTYFGPGSSRPVIRGLQGDRVRTLQSGVGTGDVSATGPDHAVATEPLLAGQIEILRGPATLLYGSSAIGGVVNSIDPRIPREISTHPLTGFAQVQGGSVNDEFNGAASLNSSVGSFGLHASGLIRETSDYRIPGFAEIDPLPGEEEPGVIENSALETLTGSFGTSWVGSAGYLGAAVTGYGTRYGIPGHAHAHEEEHEDGEEHEGEEHEGEEHGEESVELDLAQFRADVEGAWSFGSAVVRTAKLRAGYADYTHTEFEGEEVGTRFDSEALEARLEATHAPLGPLNGTLGVQYGTRDLKATGDEAFIPETRTNVLALFLYEELPVGPVRFAIGGRWEGHENETVDGFRRSNDGLSGSLGVNWAASEAITIAATGSRSSKLPSAEELFSDGPHIATRLYEIGDPDLRNEVGYSGDLALTFTAGRVTGQVAGFLTAFEDFIFLMPSDSMVDGLTVATFEQADANFRGYEIDLQYSLLHRPQNHLALTAFSDYVWAETRDSGEPLPYIPPLRWGAGGLWEYGQWRATLNVRRVEEQSRVSEFETETPGYTMLDASVSYAFFTGSLGHEILLRGTNLTDEEARNHVSVLKDTVPLPGRDIRLTYRLMF
ncbi:MAG: TonB-dependent receptor [marine benthic group bacterium]|nr:TonB-dependent receptor [Gemmatimonadota bacterium]